MNRFCWHFNGTVIDLTRAFIALSVYVKRTVVGIALVPLLLIGKTVRYCYKLGLCNGFEVLAVNRPVIVFLKALVSIL